MKVNMTFAVEWTTKAVVKEPDKIRAGNGTLTFAVTGRNATSIELITPTGEQATAEAIVSSQSMVEMTWIEIMKWMIF